MKHSFCTRKRVLSLVTSMVAVLFLVVATGPASASPTASVVTSTKVLKVEGGSEESDIHVSFDAGNYVVENLVGDLAVAGSSCILLATNKASCFYGGLVPPSFLITLGTGLDSATIEGSVPDVSTAVVKGVNAAESQSAPLDVTTDADADLLTVTGGPSSDRISVDSPTGCKAGIDGGGGDDEIYVDIDNRDALEELGCASWPYALSGGNGDDLIDASKSQADVRYSSSEGHDVFVGGSGNDHITVGDGPDWAFGGAGNDRFYDNGGPDPSKIWGGPGNDVFSDWDGNFPQNMAGSDRDITFYDGGSGTDAVAYRNVYGAYDISLSLDGVANDGESGEYDNIRQSVELVGDPNFYGEDGQFIGDDVLIGSNGPNTIGGMDGDDTVTGLGGQDFLKGGDGVDVVSGGVGPDVIHGGAGSDELYGGDGDDEIFAEDGEIDVISCGDGDDVVHADPNDEVSPDCD